MEEQVEISVKTNHSEQGALKGVKYVLSYHSALLLNDKIHLVKKNDGNILEMAKICDTNQKY